MFIFLTTPPLLRHGTGILETQLQILFKILRILLLRAGNMWFAIRLRIASAALITILPNPVSNRFKIYDARFTISEINIYDARGRQFFSRQLKAGRQQQVDIDASQWNSGVYFIRILNDRTYRTLKLIKL